ncbi:MAG: enoyl-CoA hydratase/isomerase family protein [Acidimicrobiia bacterium]|nr:enoyl-CoA hydratase/isomerase family protein [Acidimicrobiia bacterium]
MNDNAPLLVEDRGPARWIWFNRPRVHNAQNTAMLEAFDNALELVRQDAGVRVVVLAGKGRSFCSGHDLKEIVAHADYARAVETVEGRMRWEQRLFVDPVNRFRELPVPTVVLAHGHCLAAGLMFVSVADFVYATPDAVFGSPIIPAMGINDAEVPAFAWAVGSRRAKQTLWLDQRMDAQTAREVGLVSEVLAPDEIEERIESVVQSLAAIPAETLMLSKLSLRQMEDQAGYQAVSGFHFLSHSLSHHTTGAMAALAERQRRLSGPEESH